MGSTRSTIENLNQGNITTLKYDIHFVGIESSTPCSEGPLNNNLVGTQYQREPKPGTCYNLDIDMLFTDRILYTIILITKWAVLAVPERTLTRNILQP